MVLLGGMACQARANHEALLEEVGKLELEREAEALRLEELERRETTLRYSHDF